MLSVKVQKKTAMLAPGARWLLRTCVTLFVAVLSLSCGVLLYRTLVFNKVVETGVKHRHVGERTTFLISQVTNKPDYQSQSSEASGSGAAVETFIPQPVRSAEDNLSSPGQNSQQLQTPSLGSSASSHGRCSPHTSLAFVKVHKAGSTTITCIFQRFGYEHNLTFMLPRNHMSDIGWPNLLKVEDYIPSATGQFDMLVDHTVYNRQLMAELMPNNTVYIAVLRHPLAQIKSVFNWYRIRSEYRINHADPLGAFLKDPDRYEAPYVTNRRHRAPHSLTKNFMAFDLGFLLGLSGRRKSAEDFVRKIDEELDFVLILEHLNESLVMLRRLMCWTTKDILYDLIPRNLKSYPEKFAASAQSQQGAHRKWSDVDYNLYEHFNRSLWERVANEGPDFLEEVTSFQLIVSKVGVFCDAVVGTAAHVLYIEGSKWSEGFTVDHVFCTKLQMQWKDWYYVLKKTHKLPQNVSSSVTETIGYPGLVSLTIEKATDIFGINP